MKHPLIVRLREISASLRRIAKTDRMVQRGAKKGSAPKIELARIDAFYDGTIQAGTMAARLIDEALKNFPLSGRGCAGAAPSLPRKGAKA